MSKPFPPAGYIQTDSTIEGIQIFKPRPPKPETHQEIVDFSCPQCDATRAFSTEDGGLTCDHCGYHEPPKHEVVGKDATLFEFKIETLERAAHGWGSQRKELDCQKCGARTTISEEMLTHTCPFCDSNQVVQVKAPQDELRPRHLVPFGVSADKAQSNVLEWLDSSWMTPDNLKRKARSTDYRPVFLPFWTFDARNTATWSAEVGERITETYYQDGQRKTRTRIVWKHESGRVNHFYEDVIVPGSNKISTVLLNRINRYDLNQLVPYDPSYLAGMLAQAYDIKLEPAWELGRQRLREQTKRRCEHQASTSMIRNFQMTVDFSEEAWRHILAPIYIAVYRYDNKDYQVVVNGATGQVAGQQPVDWPMVWLAIAACLAPGVILGLIAIVTLFFGLGFFVAPFAFAALGFGWRYGMKLYRQAEAMEDV